MYHFIRWVGMPLRLAMVLGLAATIGPFILIAALLGVDEDYAALVKKCWIWVLFVSEDYYYRQRGD